ncbi:MAG: DUF1499 domain-containing protein [Aureliella sp.]
MKKRSLIIPVIILLFAFLGLQVLNAMSKPQSELGVTAGQLAKCPDKPNCVSSQATGEHSIEPLAFDGDAASAWATLKAVVEGFPRTTAVTEEADYMHYEFRTAIMRYVDDVEFLLDEEQSVIHVRSASRIGYSDLGANRKRVEQLRQAFAAKLAG